MLLSLFLIYNSNFTGAAIDYMVSWTTNISTYTGWHIQERALVSFAKLVPKGPYWYTVHIIFENICNNDPQVSFVCTPVIH